MNTNYKEAPNSNFHKTVYIRSIMGQIACGYALGIAGTAVVEAKGVLGLNAFWVGLLGAGTLIGLGGSFFIGNLADRIGRSKLLLINMILLSLLTVLHLFVSNVGLILIIRIAIGLCIAIEYSLSGTVLAEWLPKKKAPAKISHFLIFWTIGYVASFAAGLVMSNMGTDFHIIFASSVVLSGMAAIYRLVARVPESPCWLASVGRLEEANDIVARTLGPEYHVIVAEASDEEEQKVTIRELFGKKYRNNTLIGGIFYACQVFPFYGVSLFLPILVSKMDMGGDNASNIIYDVFCLGGALIGTAICCKISRRFFLISTFFGSAIALMVMIIGQYVSMTLTIIAFAVYALVMSIAMVLEWPYPTELFDDRARGTGVGIVVALSRIGAALGTFLLPILVSCIGATGSLLVCAGVLLIGGVACFIMAPETNHKFIKKAELKRQKRIEKLDADAGTLKFLIANRAG